MRASQTKSVKRFKWQAAASRRIGFRMSQPVTPGSTNADASVPPPFVLEPILVERIWGTRNLTPWHTAAVDGDPVGEIWLTAETCLAIESSPHRRTLAEITSAAPDLLGDPRHEGFPLLIKLLFPHEKLSVQVHPDDAQARALGMPRGKTECWYVLSADPGAQVAVGFRNPLTPAEVRAAIKDGTLEDQLRMIPVKAGDMVFVDAGTVHAIGPGMVVLETQQYSDTTYRLWDYGRPRDLHVEAGTAVTRTETAAGLIAPQLMDGFTRLVTSDYFAVDRFQLESGESALGAEGKLQILIPLDDGCLLLSDSRDPLPLPRAKAVVVPGNAGPSRLHASKPASMIRVLQP